MAFALDPRAGDPTAAPAPARQIEIEGVSKAFAVGEAAVQALQDVSLSVAAGEFVSLIGPSGCGKSTLLRLLAGLDRPDCGTVCVGGEPIMRPSTRRGIVFQDHRLLPWLSVADNIRLSLRSRPGSDAQKRERVAELVALVGLSDFADAYPHQLSGGMSQRAAIARALAPRPEILLLDEPLGALDHLTRGLLQAELLRLWEHERITMIMVTHDVEEAVFLSDRIVVMHPRPGRIRAIVEVGQPRPRLRAAPGFVAQREHILSLIGAA